MGIKEGAREMDDEEIDEDYGEEEEDEYVDLNLYEVPEEDKRNQ